MWLLYPVEAGGSRKRPLVGRRPSVSEGSPGRAAQIQSDMGDSNSGVIPEPPAADPDLARDKAAPLQAVGPASSWTRPLNFINAELELDEVRVVLAPADQMKTAAVDQDLGR